MITKAEALARLKKLKYDAVLENSVLMVSFTQGKRNAFLKQLKEDLSQMDYQGSFGLSLKQNAAEEKASDEVEEESLQEIETLEAESEPEEENNDFSNDFEILEQFSLEDFGIQ